VDAGGDVGRGISLALSTADEGGEAGREGIPNGTDGRRVVVIVRTRGRVAVVAVGDGGETMVERGGRPGLAMLDTLAFTRIDPLWETLLEASSY